MRFEQERATLAWPFPLLGRLAASPTPLNMLVGWRVLVQLTAAQKRSISLQEAHGEVTIHELYEISFFCGRGGRGGELGVSPPGALRKFSSARPSSFRFCVNFPFTQLKRPVPDSKI